MRQNDAREHGDDEDSEHDVLDRPPPLPFRRRRRGGSRGGESAFPHLNKADIISVGEKVAKEFNTKRLFGITGRKKKRDDVDDERSYPSLLLFCVFLDEEENENVALFIIIAEQEELHNW